MVTVRPVSHLPLCRVPARTSNATQRKWINVQNLATKSQHNQELVHTRSTLPSIWHDLLRWTLMMRHRWTFKACFVAGTTTTAPRLTLPSILASASMNPEEEASLNVQGRLASWHDDDDDKNIDTTKRFGMICFDEPQRGRGISKRCLLASPWHDDVDNIDT